MRIPSFLPVLVCLLSAFPAAAADPYDVTRYGATGRKDDDAQPAIQRAIDACAAAGGGTVHVPPGAYTSPTLQLRSHVTLHLEAGATLYASRQEDADPLRKESGYRETGVPVLLYGRDLTRIRHYRQGHRGRPGRTRLEPVVGGGQLHCRRNRTGPPEYPLNHKACREGRAGFVYFSGGVPSPVRV